MGCEPYCCACCLLFGLASCLPLVDPEAVRHVMKDGISTIKKESDMSPGVVAVCDGEVFRDQKWVIKRVCASFFLGGGNLVQGSHQICHFGIFTLDHGNISQPSVPNYRLDL